MWQIDEGKMKYIFFVLIIILAFVIGSACTLLVLYAAEQNDKKKKLSKRLRKVQPEMCERTRAAGVCPKECSKCAWGWKY